MLIILHLNNEVIKIYHIMHGYEKSFVIMLQNFILERRINH